MPEQDLVATVVVVVGAMLTPDDDVRLGPLDATAAQTGLAASIKSQNGCYQSISSFRGDVPGNGGSCATGFEIPAGQGQICPATPFFAWSHG